MGISLLRKELVEIYAIRELKREEKVVSQVDRKGNKELELFSQNILKAANEVVHEIDSLQVFFFSSQ